MRHFRGSNTGESTRRYIAAKALDWHLSCLSSSSLQYPTLSDEDKREKENGEKWDCDSEEYAIAQLFLMMGIAFRCFNGPD